MKASNRANISESDVNQTWSEYLVNNAARLGPEQSLALRAMSSMKIISVTKRPAHNVVKKSCALRCRGVILYEVMRLLI